MVNDVKLELRIMERVFALLSGIFQITGLCTIIWWKFLNPECDPLWYTGFIIFLIGQACNLTMFYFKWKIIILENEN